MIHLYNEKDSSVNLGLKKYKNLKEIQRLDISTKGQNENSIIIDKYVVINNFNYMLMFF